MAERILKGLIKLAAVCLTAPATLAVASTIYSEYLILRWVVAVACLMLVEGALLLGWSLLDTQGKTATAGQRGLYASLVIVSYSVLWVVAIAHGEGIPGVAFRLTLGVVLCYSLAEAGVLASLRQDAQIARDIGRDRHVRRHERALAVKDAIAELDSQYDLKARQRAQVAQQNLAQLDMQHRQAMTSIKGRRNANTEAFPYDLSKARTIQNGRRAQRKQQALAQIVAARRVNPDISRRELATICGVSRQSVGNYLAELRAGDGAEGQHQLSFAVDGLSGNGSHSEGIQDN